MKILLLIQLWQLKKKTDFKAILNTFVYGSVSNIPVEEKEVVIEEKKW